MPAVFASSLAAAKSFLSSGNIRERAFEDIWCDSPVFAALREPERLLGKCGACEFKRICSGCRARAYALTGNFLDEEPCCAYEPGARLAVPPADGPLT